MDAVFLYFCQQFYEEAFKINAKNFHSRIINCLPDTISWETEILTKIVSTWNKKFASLLGITPLEIAGITNAYFANKPSLLPKDYKRIILHVLNQDIYKLASKFISQLMFLESEDGETIVLEKVDSVDYNGNKYVVFFPLDKGIEPIITLVEYTDEGKIYQNLENKKVYDAVFEIFKEHTNNNPEKLEG